MELRRHECAGRQAGNGRLARIDFVGRQFDDIGGPCGRGNQGDCQRFSGQVQQGRDAWDFHGMPSQEV